MTVHLSETFRTCLLMPGVVVDVQFTEDPIHRGSHPQKIPSMLIAQFSRMNDVSSCS